MYYRTREVLKSESEKELAPGRDRGLEQPAWLKDYSREGEILDLPEPDEGLLVKGELHRALLDRETCRLYSGEGLGLEEVSYLLKMTQGVRAIREDNRTLKRYVPSASGRHSFESYIIANRIEGLERAVYRYLPLDHQLLLVRREEDLEASLVEAVNGQSFAAQADLILVWAAKPARMEWRFGSQAYKMILLDGGHIGQNMYLAAEGLGLGACVLADYDQEKLDRLIGVDGEDEISTYIGLCGRKKL